MRVLALNLDLHPPGKMHEFQAAFARDVVERQAHLYFHDESGEWDDEVGIWDARRAEREPALNAAATGMRRMSIACVPPTRWNG